MTPTRSFLHTGVDYAGPVLRTTREHGHKAYKAVIAVFVCLATRAVHLEVVFDYTFEVFLPTLRRFTSRQQRRIAEQLACDQIQWSFNPPSAPHFGGLWEATVKSLKHYLRRVLGEATLTYEEMSTLLTQVEGCLNSRSL
ncbi:uncharacterized protein LOC116852727 [Odontomachus brunneus]|uniref:uncharacterized protein LOC116852727 n=1 Tax=Odontomachus brunneus TaxID=486640 RepID=UPI0013F29011|nr:uncharacterized protein LOC116852727 [Odontomachus brunneus]